MEKKTTAVDNNLIELNEEKEEQKVKPQPTQTPTRELRHVKKVNYSKFFSEDPDNSEDYEPEEKSLKTEITKKRSRPKSVTKSTSNKNTAKKKKEENETNNKMDIEETNQEKNNENTNTNANTKGYDHIINIAATLAKYSNTNNENITNNINNINIPNSDLILIILEICLNSSQFGIEKDNSSRLFWDEVGKIELLKPITSKFKTETLRKYWRVIRQAKKYKKIIAETKKYKNELDNNNLKLLSSIKIICEYVSSQSKKKIEYFLDKHIIKPANKTKKINVNDMSASEQVSDVINTFISCFPKKKEKEIIEVLFQTSFDIENAFLVLKDKENLGFFCFSEKDDEIVKRNYEDNDEKNEEYQELVNVKGLEDVIRRKEFLFNVTIDRNQYNKIEEDNENEKGQNELKVSDNGNKKENNDNNKESNKGVNLDNKDKENEKNEGKEKDKKTPSDGEENNVEDKNKEKENDKDKEKKE